MGLDRLYYKRNPGTEYTQSNALKPKREARQSVSPSFGLQLTYVFMNNPTVPF